MINLGLFTRSKKITYGFGLFDFYDPRALEDDDKYRAYLEGRQYTSSRMFTSLLRHLELEFKDEWLKKLQHEELQILRNAIYISYGYQFKNPTINKYFDESGRTVYICRDGVCGRPDVEFSVSYLTAIDWKNLALIKRLEKGSADQANQGLQPAQAGRFKR